jgi:polysaccharide export outer membrane protein
MQTPSFKIPKYKDSILFTDYKLRLGDRIYIRIYSTDTKTNSLLSSTGGTSGAEQMTLGSGGGMSDLYTYKIEDDGNISFPMIGNVYVVGHTIREATSTIEKAIEPLLKFNSIEIKVLNRSFSVIGNGNSAYITMNQEKINIFKALALAGDIGFFDDRSKIRILRETEKGVQIKIFDVRSADIVHSEFYYIEPNDVIYIQPLNEQFFRISNLSGFISTVITSFSFGVLIYDSASKIGKSSTTN